MLARMRAFRKSDLVTLAALLFGLVAFAFTDRMPSVHAPLPVFMFITVPYLSVPAYVAIYWFWCRPALEAQADTPLRTQLLLFGVTALSALWYCLGAPGGVAYQGRRYVVACTSISAGYAIAAYAMWWWNRSRPAPWRNAVLGFLVFAWLGTYAFPWFGETI